MIRNTARTSLKHRRCERCRGPIAPGDAYLSSVASPHHNDLGNPTWWRLVECRPCAESCGRGHLFKPMHNPSGDAYCGVCGGRLLAENDWLCPSCSPPHVASSEAS